MVAGCVAPGRTRSLFSSVASDRGPGHQTQEPDARAQSDLNSMGGTGADPKWLWAGFLSVLFEGVSQH